MMHCIHKTSRWQFFRTLKFPVWPLYVSNWCMSQFEKYFLSKCLKFPDDNDRGAQCIMFEGGPKASVLVPSRAGADAGGLEHSDV